MRTGNPTSAREEAVNSVLRGNQATNRRCQFLLTIISAATLALLCFASIPARATEIVGWGNNDSGQITIPSNLTNAVVLAAATNSAAVTADGRLIGWGLEYDGQPSSSPTGLSNVVDVKIAGSHFGRGVALLSTGEIRSWGDGFVQVPANLTNVVAAAEGDAHAVVLLADSTVVTWGVDWVGVTNVPSGLSNVVSIAAGAYHTLAVKDDGSVVAWGENGWGQCDVPAEATNVVATAGGFFSSFALTATGHVIGWGQFNSGGGAEATTPPVGLSNVVAISAGGNFALALTAGGKVVSWGHSAFGQTNVASGLSNVVSIAAGTTHSLALVDRGGETLWSLLKPEITTNGIAIKLLTQRGRLYLLEHKSFLADTQWRVVQRIAGDGSFRRIVVPVQSQGFYRGRRIP